MTNEPAGRIAALLAPLRALADEVVIAADARVDTVTLAGYAALADPLFTVDFLLYERHLSWLHAQCTSDWILPPYFLTLLVEQERDFTIFEAGVFYPYLWDEPERAQDAFPDAYLVHHWALSWLSKGEHV